MSSKGVLVQPDQGNYKEHPGAWREIQQVVGLLLGQGDWGAPVALTSYSNTAQYAVTIQNQGANGLHLNIPAIFVVNNTGAFASLLTATDLTVTRNTILGTNASNALTVYATSTVEAPVTIMNGAATVLAVFDTTAGAQKITLGSAAAPGLYVDVQNVRTIIGSTTALSGAADDKLSVIGGALHIASGASGLVLGLRDGTAGSSWKAYLSAASNPDLLFKDDSDTERFRIGDGGASFQAVVTGVLNVTNGISITSSGLQIIAGGATITGAITSHSGITLDGPSNIDGNGGTDGQLRIGAGIFNAASLSGAEKLRVGGDALIEGNVNATGAVVSGGQSGTAYGVYYGTASVASGGGTTTVTSLASPSGLLHCVDPSTGDYLITHVGSAGVTGTPVANIGTNFNGTGADAGAVWAVYLTGGAVTIKNKRGAGSRTVNWNFWGGV